MVVDLKQPRDADGLVLSDPVWSPLRCEKLVTFAGATSGAWGDKDGALASGAIFRVTGTVRVRIVGVVETSLVGAGKVKVGCSGSGQLASLLNEVTNAETMDESQLWHDGTVDAKIELSSVVVEKIVPNGEDILLTVGTADITAGAIRFLVSWYPISKGASVVPSTN